MSMRLLGVALLLCCGCAKQSQRLEVRFGSSVSAVQATLRWLPDTGEWVDRIQFETADGAKRHEARFTPIKRNDVERAWREVLRVLANAPVALSQSRIDRCVELYSSDHGGSERVCGSLEAVARAIRSSGIASDQYIAGVQSAYLPKKYWFRDLAIPEDVRLRAYYLRD